jgi:two-component system chemotaxis response regulator CheY
MENAVKQCLIVDDSRIIRKVARKIVENLHFAAEEAEDGVTALEICRKAMPDAIILDCHMPNMSGIDFLRALRRETGGEKPVVVYLTTEHDVLQLNEAIGAGANEYLLKPFDRESIEGKFTEMGLM